jgi:hypothetical protein
MMKQVQYIDNDPQLQNVNNGMLKELNLDVEQLAQELLKGQGVKITSFKVGDEETPIEEKAAERLTEQGKNFEIQLKQIKTLIEKDLEKSKNTVNPDELNKIIADLNLTKVNIDNYNKLQPLDKVGLEVLHSDVVDQLNKAFEEVEAKLVEVQQGLPFEPPEPKPKGKTQLDKDIELLNKYVNSVGLTYSKKIRKALSNIPNSETTIEGANAIKNRNFDKPKIATDIRNLIRNFLQKENLLQTKIEMKPSSEETAVDI